MITQGKVISVYNNLATVSSNRSSACASCSECENKGMCHAELIFGNENSKTVEISAINEIGAKVGDIVEIQASSTKTLFSAAIVFVLPIAITILSAFIIQYYFETGFMFPFVLLIVFLLSFVCLTKIMNIYTKKRVISKIVKILEESGDNIERE